MNLTTAGPPRLSWRHGPVMVWSKISGKLWIVNMQFSKYYIVYSSSWSFFHVCSSPFQFLTPIRPQRSVFAAPFPCLIAGLIAVFIRQPHVGECVPSHFWETTTLVVGWTSKVFPRILKIWFYYSMFYFLAEQSRKAFFDDTKKNCCPALRNSTAP